MSNEGSGVNYEIITNKGLFLKIQFQSPFTDVYKWSLKAVPLAFGVYGTVLN